MGRKSRAKIEDEFYREQYFRYLKMLGDPEYKVLWEELNKINEKLKANPNDVKPWSKKESIEQKLRNKFRLAIPDIPHSSWVILTEEEKKALELPIKPAKPLTEEEFRYFIEVISFPIFLDMDIVKPIPFKQPKLIPNLQNSQRGKLDFTDYLWPDFQTGEPRYLRIEIDTWNKMERIVAAVKERLEILRDDLGIIKFKSRFRETKVDTEMILLKRIQGMSVLKIMQEYYHTKKLPTYSPTAERRYKRIKRALRKVQPKK